jgi:hypothetical protein
VGASAEYNWLENHAVTSFVDCVGAFTERKSGTGPMAYTGRPMIYVIVNSLVVVTG